jgi:drug/metabolite transporter (DMT)-like permease
MSGAPAMALLMAIPLLNEIPSRLSVSGVIIVTLGILMTLGFNWFKPILPSRNTNNKNTAD